MSASNQVVITGLGVISPIGVGNGAFWDSLRTSRNGVGPLRAFDASTLPVRIAGEITDFDPKEFVQPRKSLKIMARDTQFGVTVSRFARESAGLGPGDADPDRFGVTFGADPFRQPMDITASTYGPCIVDGQFEFSRWAREGLAGTYPLEMLRLLPNMLSCQISIANDARGPANTLLHNEVSGILAVGEAMRVIERGQADLMLAGAASSRTHPIDWICASLNGQHSRKNDDPEHASRPFDLDRDGQVRGEGAAGFLLESRSTAKRRGARPLARIAGWASAYGGLRNGNECYSFGLRAAILKALEDAGLAPHDIGYISARGLGTRTGDAQEAAVLAEILPGVPVTALKSLFGNLEAASSAVEMAAAVLALEHDEIPATRNYRTPDPQCPVNIVVERGQPLKKDAVLIVGQTNRGQAAAMILTRE